jgi:Uma2 family endonuclease
MATHTLMTAEQFDALPGEDGRHWELLEGELIEMASATAKHNRIQAQLNATLDLWLAKDNRGVTLPTTEFAFGANRFQPDLAVLLQAKWTLVEQDRVPVLIIPDIAVEIVSPSESAVNLDRKLRIYRAHGVTEVWIVYPEGSHMYVHAANGVRELLNTDVLESPVLPGWSLPVAELFAR